MLPASEMMDRWTVVEVQPDWGRMMGNRSVKAQFHVTPIFHHLQRNLKTHDAMVQLLTQ